MSEEWRAIKGFEGYEVSDLGRVKSTKYNKSRILKPCYDKRGYARLILMQNGKGKAKLVHRLVAEAFIVNPCRFPEVNHKDENPRNNELSNLEWCDKVYNSVYGTRIERMKANSDYEALAEKNRIRVNQYDLQGNFIKQWKSANECKSVLGFDNSHIAKCCRGVYKHAYGFKWSYEQ